MVVRRRSCFSCGEVQSGSAAFCSACGKPLDAPDLEFVSVDSTAASGNDVVMSTGGGKGRSAVAIIAVLAALGGVAAFSGKSTPATSAKSTTTASAKSTRTTALVKATTTTSTVPVTTVTEAGTSTTIDEAVRARELALAQPRTLATPMLPEKTGIKLLLIGLTMVGSGQRGNAIVDLDSGLVTPYPADDAFSAPTVLTYGSGLLLSNPTENGTRFDTWQPTGPTPSASVTANPGGFFSFVSVLIGDVFWSMGRNALVRDNSLPTLVGYDVRDGHTVADVALPESAQLIGSDATNRPVIVDYGSGTYAFDPATQQFTRITTNMASVVRGDWRVERTCTEQLVCGSVVFHGSDAPRPVPGLDASFGPVSLSPDGQTMVQASFGAGPATLETVDLVTGTQQKINMSADTYPIPLAWSADGSWLFGFANGVLSAWKVGTTETVSLAFDGDPVRAVAFGVFPS